MNDWYVESTPFINSNTESDGFSSNRKHSRMMTGQDDASSGRYSRLNKTDDVWDGQAVEERPHSKVLEPSG